MQMTIKSLLYHKRSIYLLRILYFVQYLIWKRPKDTQIVNFNFEEILFTYCAYMAQLAKSYTKIKNINNNLKLILIY